MPTITLSRQEVEKLVNHCKVNGKTEYFIAKDHGAYLGAAPSKSGHKCIFYFKGCDPDKNPDFYEKSRQLFGGDDFGEFFDVAILEQAVGNPRVAKVKWTVTKTAIKITCLG